MLYQICVCVGGGGDLRERGEGADTGRGRQLRRAGPHLRNPQGRHREGRKGR